MPWSFVKVCKYPAMITHCISPCKAFQSSLSLCILQVNLNLKVSLWAELSVQLESGLAYFNSQGNFKAHAGAVMIRVGFGGRVYSTATTIRHPNMVLVIIKDLHLSQSLNSKP